MRKKGINFVERHEKGITLIELVITTASTVKLLAAAATLAVPAATVPSA